MSRTRKSRSQPALLPPIDDPERILREKKLSVHTVCSHEGPKHVSNDECEPIHTSYKGFQLLEREESPPPHVTHAQSAPTTVNVET